MLQHCSGPIWQVDDFTNCFQQAYLKTIFPLVIIGLSFIHLAHGAVRRRLTKASKDKAAYKPLANGADGLVPPVNGQAYNASNEDDEDEDDLTMPGGRLILAKTTTRDSVVAVDRPRGEKLMVVVEMVAILGELAISITGLLTDAYGSHGRTSTIIDVVVWAYILVLASGRLFLGNTKWRVPRLWNHTAIIYTILWLFSLIILRSAIVHPRSHLAQNLSIADFVLVSLLFVIALSTRKGNKAVLLEWEGNIQPSQEPLASVFSLATFAWVDPIVWQGYRQTFEMEHVWNLIPKDKAAQVLADYRQLKKTTSLVFHLLKYFKGSILIQCIYATLSGFFTFLPTLLLKAILEYIEDDNGTPRNVVWLYVSLLAITDLIRSLADQQALWIGRKICIRLRAIIIGEIYAKALRRKAATSKDSVLGDDKKDDKKTKKADPTPTQKKSWLKKILGGSQDDAEPTDEPADGPAEADASITKPEPAAAADEQANVGTIINLMSVDSFKVSEVSAYLHFLMAAAPTQLIVSIFLLYQLLGWSSIPGLIVMVILLPVNIGFAYAFGKAQKKIMAATDKRIHQTNEILQNIRIIKFFAWEDRFGSILGEKRQTELKHMRGKYMIWACAVAVWNSVPVVITFFSFLVYTVVEKKPLYPSVAFTAISLFNLLRVPLDQLGDMIAHVQESKVSVDRVEEFLSEEETEKYEQLSHGDVDENGDKRIGFVRSTFTWGGKNEKDNDENRAFRLIDMDIKFAIGKLNIVAGPTGSGKTSLLMALLGEMTLVKGQVFLPGGSREDLIPDEDGLIDSVAYCAQQAWLVNANIKENILFASPYNEKRYKDVIVACALQRDLEILEAGDETLVGEKGIALSGGQKQRISLARALYSNARHVLLDDCLSAVDSHTAKWIFEECITGPLMRNRTCILVTHNVALCLPKAHHVVLLDNGKIDIEGSPDKVIASGKLGADVQKLSRPGSASASRIPSRVPSTVGQETEQAIEEAAKPTDDGPKKEKPSDAMQESKATGSVKWSVMKVYLTAMGPWWFWIIALSIFGIQQVAMLTTNIWIRQWANQYNVEEVSQVHQFSSMSNSIATSSSLSELTGSLQAKLSMIPTLGLSTTPMTVQSTTQEVNIAYYLTVYALIGFVGMFLAFFRDLWLFFGSLTASWTIHERLMTSVSRAKFKFFDQTPLGQLMNRFSKDLEAVDQEVAPVAIGIMSFALSIIMTVILITAITPGFLIPAIFIGILYYLIGMFYLASSRDLKRLESVQRSPLFQQFGETLSGITTIRAYGDERRFITDNLQRINTHSRPFIYLWGANRWLSFRVDLAGDLVSFFAGVFVITNLGRIDAGSAGLSLGYAIAFTENVLWLVRLYAMNEQNMNSVERIKEYLDVEQEAQAVIEDTKPAANWPSQGSVEFINYKTRYRPDLEPVLKNVTFKINPMEKVGIVGRTGAGKSSLALALFRGLEAEEGKILVDDVDIGLIGLQTLRESITIVPQDPTLFTGTIRSNLDPFDLFTDEEVFTALRRVHLIGSPSPPSTPLDPSRPSTPGDITVNKNIFLNLSSSVAESGSNLSQGQRQLLCLARALLKNPKVIMMDEATASIDYATDSKIQETIRELKSTIVTIAHRLQTIADYDKVLVLDKGQVVEYGHPYELIKREGKDAIFRSMCETSGDFDTLVAMSKKAFDASRLVDVD